MTRAYSTGQETGKADGGGSLRYLGYSRSRERDVAIDVSNGGMYLLDPLEKLEDVRTPTHWPHDAPGGSAWNDWADGCFDASSLGKADRMSAEEPDPDKGDK